MCNWSVLNSYVIDPGLFKLKNEENVNVDVITESETCFIGKFLKIIY